MSRILETLLDEYEETFRFFDQVYLFGSSLRLDSPNDIDILLVYENKKLDQVKLEKSKVEKILLSKFGDCNLDFTTLSSSEMAQTNFLLDVQHEKVKG